MHSATVESCRTVETEIRSLLYELADAYYAQDLPRLLANYAPDDEAILLGSTAEERLVGRDAIGRAFQQDFARSGRVCVEYGWTSVSARDNIAWAAAECLVHLHAGGEDISLPSRITIVCENRDGRWLIVQQHFSLPAAA